MRTRDEVRDILGRETVLVRREQTRVTGALDRLIRDGEVRAVLPGVYAAANQASDPRVRVLAVTRAHPNAVITHQAAAWLTYWPQVVPDVITVNTKGELRPQPGFTFTRRHIPPELVLRRDHLQVTRPALTALDLSSLEQSEPLDVALRHRAVTLDQLHDALRLTAGRRGNNERRQLLLDSRAEPWSYAERLAHCTLRANQINDWTANLPVRLANSNLYYLDIAFERLRLGVEIDGRIHLQPGQFEADRHRQNQLQLAGWLILRFTLTMLVNDPDHFVSTIREALVLRRRHLR